MSDSPIEGVERPWVTHLFLIIPNAQNVLLLPSAEGWRLPSVRVEGTLWFSDSLQVSEILRQELGLDFAFTLLRNASHREDDVTRLGQDFLVLEVHPPLLSPPLGGSWVSSQEVVEFNLALPEERALLLTYFSEFTEQSIPAQRVPWAYVGWFQAARAWMEAELVRLGYEQSGAVEQVRNWSLSCVLRVPTQIGMIYFKAAADLPLFVNEPLFVAKLAALFPDSIPAPLVLDVERGWMLMADFGKSLRAQGKGEHDFAPVLAAYGQLQRQSATHVEKLIASSGHDRRLEILASQIESLLTHPLSQSVLEPAEWESVQRLAPQLSALCVKLSEYNLPNTLLHGDLHMGNVAGRDGTYLFFDWTDGCVGHPFIDMLHVYFYENSEIEKVRLRDAYLAQWEAYEPRERLLEAWKIAKPLSALHQAVSYLSIVGNLEPMVRAELIHGLSDFMRYMLASLSEEVGALTSLE
jgi:hypothetical protein